MFKTLISSFFLFIAYFAKAQEMTPFSIGATFGLNTAYTELITHKIGYTTAISSGYNFNPYFSTDLEAQFGKILGGNEFIEEDGRQFINKYKSLTVILKFGLGALNPDTYDETLLALNKVYFGIGGGLIFNKMAKINRTKPNGFGLIPGENQSINLMVPLVIGFNLPLQSFNGESRFSINFNVQGSVTFGEGLDGYNDKSSTANNRAPDFYTVVSVGLRYAIGSHFSSY